MSKSPRFSGIGEFIRKCLSRLPFLFGHFVLTMVIGLFQIWILLLSLYLREVHFDYLKLISDGILFFFASSIMASSFISHFAIIKKQNPIIWGEFIAGFGLLIIVMTICTIGYITMIEPTVDKNDYTITITKSQHIAQISCAFMAMMYSFFVEHQIKFSERNED